MFVVTGKKLFLVTGEACLQTKVAYHGADHHSGFTVQND